MMLSKMTIFESEEQKRQDAAVRIGCMLITFKYLKRMKELSKLKRGMPSAEKVQWDTMLQLAASTSVERFGYDA